jgi:hypothetical protein
MVDERYAPLHKTLLCIQAKENKLLGTQNKMEMRNKQS